MIKGINKQIIEIRCTNDEYFEKALLFVRADRADAPYDEVLRNAENYASEIAAQIPSEAPRRRGQAVRLFLIGAGATAAAALALWLLMLR